MTKPPGRTMEAGSGGELGKSEQSGEEAGAGEVGQWLQVLEEFPGQRQAQAVELQIVHRLEFE